MVKTETDVEQVGAAKLLYPNLTNDDIVCMYSFHGRIETADNHGVRSKDAILFVFTKAPELKCVMVGKEGYFKDRLLEMSVFGTYDEQLMYLFAVLNGSYMIQGPSTYHPQCIVDYDKFHAMCKQEEGGKLECQEQLELFSSGCLARIKHVEDHYKKKLILVHAQKQKLAEKLAQLGVHVDEEPTDDQKTSE